MWIFALNFYNYLASECCWIPQYFFKKTVILFMCLSSYVIKEINPDVKEAQLSPFYNYTQNSTSLVNSNKLFVL
jgi:hypothetical protein